jgi:hypothetical protein
MTRRSRRISTKLRACEASLSCLHPVIYGTAPVLSQAIVDVLSAITIAFPSVNRIDRSPLEAELRAPLS